MEAKKYWYCNVSVKGISRSYSYISDIGEISVSSYVEVPFGSNNISRIGIVQACGEYSFENAPYPPAQTKHIIRIASIEDYLQDSPHDSDEDDPFDEFSQINEFIAYAKWDDVLEDATGAGVDSFIAKPLFAANVLEEFESVAKRKGLCANSAEKKIDLKGKRILLAEDIEINAEIIKMLLQTRGIESERAANGKEALDMFASRPSGYYDAILMDMRMPEMDGLEATRRIRALDRSDSKTLPIIALTANAFDEDVQRSLQAGLNAHLSKPVQPEELFETLEKLIQE